MSLKQSGNLLVISSAPGSFRDGGYNLDRKFADGMRLYASLWPGRVTSLSPLAKGDAPPFSEQYKPGDLPFDIRFFRPGTPLTAADLDDADVVLCSGDNANYLHLSGLCKSLNKDIHFTIEYIPETRRQIVMLDRNKSAFRKMKSLIWLQYQELRRQHAFRQATGLQANGYPAADLYRKVNPNTLSYLDNRVDHDLLATRAELRDRQDHLRSAGPIRLIHSGRLEPMKGAQDLIPVARDLRDRGLDFSLNIFGTGSLEDQIRRDIDRHDLSDRVHLNGVVDFASRLMPYARQNADIFLSCHRQSDPSCSYLENMACGLAVIGYDNRMWQALADRSGAGWTAPLGRPAKLAERVAQAAADRAQLVTRCDAAWRFAREHLFAHEFARRIGRLKAGQTVAQPVDAAQGQPQKVVRSGH